MVVVVVVANSSTVETAWRSGSSNSNNHSHFVRIRCVDSWLGQYTDSYSIRVSFCTLNIKSVPQEHWLWGFLVQDRVVGGIIDVESLSSVNWLLVTVGWDYARCPGRFETCVVLDRWNTATILLRPWAQIPRDEHLSWLRSRCGMLSRVAAVDACLACRRGRAPEMEISLGYKSRTNIIFVACSETGLNVDGTGFSAHTSPRFLREENLNRVGG